MTVRKTSWFFAASLLLAIHCQSASWAKESKNLLLQRENPELISAIALYNAGRNWASLPILLRATESTPNDFQSWLYLARVYQNIGKLDKSVEAYDKYLELAPKGDERDKYLAFLDVLKAQAKAQMQSQSQTPKKNPGNYLSEVTPNGVFKWSQSKMPITVFIGSGNKVPGYSTDFDEAFRSALDEWEQKTAGLVSFNVVDDLEKSDIDVTWTDNLNSKALSSEAGNTSIISGADGIMKARMHLLTIDPFERGRARGKRQLRNICLHEIGHALGLNGHSGYPDDIMNAQLSAQDGVSVRDLNTLKMLYSETQKSEL